MTSTVLYPDVEVVVCDGIEAAVDRVRTGTVVPADLQQQLAASNVDAFARVLATGGRDDLVTDTTRLTIDTFAPTRSAARDTAERIRTWITTPGGRRIGNAVLDLVTTDSKPVEVPWNPTVRRFVASYTVTARPHQTQ